MSDDIVLEYKSTKVKAGDNIKEFDLKSYMAGFFTAIGGCLFVFIAVMYF